MFSKRARGSGFLWSVSLCTLISCGKPQESESNVSEVSYDSWAHPFRFGGYYQGDVRVCVVAGTGITVGDKLTAERNARSALLTWAQASSRVLAKIRPSIKLSCTTPHYVVNVSSVDFFSRVHRKDLRAFVHADRANVIEVNTSDLSYGLFLHEFGHAFAGLGDTYIDDGTGRCKEGQPASIMCSHVRFGTKPLADDIEGLRISIADTFGDYLLAGGFERIYWNPLGQFEVVKNLTFSEIEVHLGSLNFVNQFPQILNIELKSIKKKDSDCSLVEEKRNFRWDSLETYRKAIARLRAHAVEAIHCP